MDKSYYKHNYDLNSCSANALVTITILYRFLALFRKQYADNAPGIGHVVTAYIMHRFFYFFHYLYMLRDVVRKIRDRLRIFWFFRIKR
ncbi:membrane protein [Candidatus Magnetobacterium bavaricum]|uniref:Membrane protein n=1 Tax=Candidatus Magnetobacterium bavaricum TaxID=29290 RepID=A0A0F3GPY0_9BACT|nr:membrane protein [Candidatus Magnetobacterium bavaricum]